MLAENFWCPLPLLFLVQRGLSWEPLFPRLPTPGLALLTSSRDRGPPVSVSRGPRLRASRLPQGASSSAVLQLRSPGKGSELGTRGAEEALPWQAARGQRGRRSASAFSAWTRGLAACAPLPQRAASPRPPARRAEPGAVTRLGGASPSVRRPLQPRPRGRARGREWVSARAPPQRPAQLPAGGRSPRPPEPPCAGPAPSPGPGGLHPALPARRRSPVRTGTILWQLPAPPGGAGLFSCRVERLPARGTCWAPARPPVSASRAAGGSGPRGAAAAGAASSPGAGAGRAHRGLAEPERRRRRRPRQRRVFIFLLPASPSPPQARTMVQPRRLPRAPLP